MTRYRLKNRLTNLVYLVQSRRRQFVVFGPFQIMLVLGLAFGFGVLAGGGTLTATPLALTALVLSLAAATYAVHSVRTPERASSRAWGLLALGVLLVLGAILLLAGVDIGIAWPVLLVLYALLALSDSTPA